MRPVRQLVLVVALGLAAPAFAAAQPPGAMGRVESVGTFDWGGAYGSHYDVDPRERRVLVFMIQQIPDRSGVPQKLPMLVYQALVQPR